MAAAAPPRTSPEAQKELLLSMGLPFGTWRADAPLRDFEGVTVNDDGDGLVTGLSLADKKDVLFKLVDFTSLTSLKELNMKSCYKATGEISPSMVEWLSSIEDKNLTYCGKFVLTGDMNTLSITKINLSNMDTLEGDIQVFKDMAITNMNLSGCEKLTGDIESLKDCPLQTLDLSYCRSLNGNIKDLPQSITDLNLQFGTELEGDIESLKDCPLQILDLYYCEELTGNIKDLPQSITDLNLGNCENLEGTTLALASCPELVNINTTFTKIVVPIPIDKQRAFVQELAGGTLTEETITEETKDAFLKFIAYDSNAGALQSWLESKPWLAELVTPEGHEAVQLASAECRKVIADQLYFMGRYKLTSGPPEHKSMTSVVIRAIDYFPERQDPPSENQYVVFKFMINLLQFLREKSERVDNKLEPEFVIPVIDSNMVDGKVARWDMKRWASEMNRKLPQFAKYQYCIVMPAAGRNLAVVALQERMDLEAVRTTFFQLVCNFRHLHERGLIHGDGKLLNFVRMYDNTWKLTDLDGARVIGTEIDDSKDLSTSIVPPEMTHLLPSGEVALRLRKTNETAVISYEPLVAEATFDVWSVIVCLFPFIAHKPLFASDDRDNLSSKQELTRLATWGPKALSDVLMDVMAALIADGATLITTVVVCDLFTWGLQRDPAARPQSMDEVLAHPFFSSEANDDDIEGLRIPQLLAAAALGDLSTVESMVVQGAPGETEPLLGRSTLHLAAAFGQDDLVRFLIEQPTVDAGALDAAGRSPLDHAQSMLERLKGNAKWEARLHAVIGALVQADLLKQIKRQATEGVTCAEGQRVRDYFQSQIGRSVDEYRPKVMISYATGTRNKRLGHPTDLDGEGCGPGMMYTNLVVSHLMRAGIECFTGLHVEGGNNWHVYFDKLQRADVMIVIMTPAFFKSVPCFHEQLEARKNGLQVIPLLFQLEENGNPPGAVEGGGAKWIEAYEETCDKDKQAAHDTLCAFRLRDDHDQGLKLNSEPAPPNTMLDDDHLLDKLVGRVRKALDETGFVAQVERQKLEGVTCAEGQRVRDYFQSQIAGSVGEYKSNVIISYATGTRNKWTGYSSDLDGEGCGPGMMYADLIVRHLERAGIACFTGLHVEGGNNWHVYFKKLRQAKVMIAIMSPAFFKSVPCFKEQLEARKNGLQVIPLLFELEENGNPPGAVEGGGAKWIEAYESMVGGEDEQAAHDTLCAFRLKDDNDKGLKLNSEPAPPNTMLDRDLLFKLQGRVRKTLDEASEGSTAGPSTATFPPQALSTMGMAQMLEARMAQIEQSHRDWSGEIAELESENRKLKGFELRSKELEEENRRLREALGASSYAASNT